MTKTDKIPIEKLIQEIKVDAAMASRHNDDKDYARVNGSLDLIIKNARKAKADLKIKLKSKKIKPLAGMSKARKKPIRTKKKPVQRNSKPKPKKYKI